MISETAATLNHYNLALYPEDSAFASLCIELAQTNLSQLADNYLLGSDALPHVTVCQFLAPGHLMPDIWALFAEDAHQPLSLSFRHLYVQYGKAELEGKCWVGLAVRPESTIREFQKNAFAKLLEFGIEGRNFPDTYFPHLTFARCDATKPVVITYPPPQVTWLERYSFRLTLAQSDEHGRYHRQLRP